jgi:hypothetical protein
MMRRSAFIAAVALSLGWSGMAAADGLERFEKQLKPELGKLQLSYGGATAMGPSGFALSDVKGVLKDDAPDAKPEPFAVKRVVVEDFDFDHMTKDDGPRFMKLRLEGLKAGEAVAEPWLKRYGLPDIALDVTLDYRLDAERKVFTLNKFEMVAPGLARIELNMILDGVTPGSIGDSDKALNDATLRTATLTFEDGSLLGTLLPRLAAEDGKSADDYITGGLGIIALVAQSTDANVQAVLDAVASFAGDYKQPKGPLRIVVSPNTRLSAKDWEKISGAGSFVDALGLSVVYSGTRAGAAKAILAAAFAAAPRASAPAATGGLDCTTGRRLFVLSDGGWFAATVREGTQSGRRCVVRLDGDDSGDDIVVDRKEMMAWSIDGPGTAAGDCRKGDRAFIKSEGGWFPAEVRSKSGSRCTVRLEDDDDAEDEVVELRRLRVIR